MDKRRFDGRPTVRSGAAFALVAALGLLGLGLSTPASAAAAGHRAAADPARAVAYPTKPAHSTPRAPAAQPVPRPAPHARSVRACPAIPKPHMATCLALRRTGVRPDLPSGYGPANLASAYKLRSGGGGATVAIVDAYNNPNLASDLVNYRSTYGLPACTTASGCLRIVNQTGGSSLPANNAGWGAEEALDVDMVSAVCPNCKIILVEATSPTLANLGTSVNTGIRLGAKFVSNSYGGSESSSDPSYDSSYFNHPGVAITASTGDDGYGVSYPAASRYVTSVGGTRLVTAGNSRGWSESAWSGAGSGCSAYDPKPSWQTAATQCPRHANADVSAVADPATGVAVYDSYGSGGWAVYGGTSVSSPIIASVYALAGTPAAGSYPAAYPWAHPANLFDVTTGSNGSCSPSVWCHAGAGWDGPTGLGTPNGTAAFSSGSCAGAQLLGNAGFETGSAAPWSATAATIWANGQGRSSHSGSYYAWLDGYGETHTDTLSQTVTIPASCHNAAFSFWLEIDTAETTTTTAYDTMAVTAGSTTLATYSNLDHAGYGLRVFNLNPFIGQTVTLKFNATEDYSLQTSFVIDDTALNVS